MSESSTPDIESQYLYAQASFTEFVRTLSESDWSVTVPCTPDWTVRDVLSHVAGIPDDAFAGRMDGAPGEAWTAAQIDRNRPFEIGELVDRWDTQTPDFARAIQQSGQWRAAFDLHTHEHDVRHALGRPGNRESPVVEVIGRQVAGIDDLPIALDIEFTDDFVVSSGQRDASRHVTLRGMTPFEIFRSRPGRRSRMQVRAYDWTGERADVDDVVTAWSFFGPTTTDIVETV